MPHIRIPQTGTEIHWPSADAGRARIVAHLHFTTAESPVSIRIELGFKPEPFRRLFKQSDYWYGLRSILAKLYSIRHSPEELEQLLNAQERDLFFHASKHNLITRYDAALRSGKLIQIQSLDPDHLLKALGNPNRVHTS